MKTPQHPKKHPKTGAARRPKPANSAPCDMDALRQLYLEMSEHEHQRELFSWSAAVALVGMTRATEWMAIHPQTLRRPTIYVGKDGERGEEGDHRLRWLHAIPNGGTRGGNARQRAVNGARMKSEGVRAGIPDIYLPYPSNGFHGLYIELKKIGGKPSKEQREFAEYCVAVGYRFAFCEGYLEAVGVILEYLEG